MNNKTKFLAIALSILPLSARAEKISLVGGTVINPADGKVLPNATVVIDGDKIERVAIGKQDAASLGKQIDCVGKFILPGYIDTHVHFFQSGDLFTRPDGSDLNSVRPYKDEVAWVKSHVNDVFDRYLRSGITSVVDVGGPFWNFEVRKTANATAKAPRVAVAGPLISSVSREKLDLGDPPIVKIDTPDQTREFVRKLAAQNPDLVKLWYIVDQNHPVDSFRPLVSATVAETDAHQDGAGQAGRGARPHQENLRCRAQESKNTGGRWSSNRSRHRCGKHRHDSWAGFVPRVSIDEGSRADADADFAMCYCECRAIVRRRNRRAHRQNRKGIFRRSRCSELESGR